MTSPSEEEVTAALFAAGVPNGIDFEWLLLAVKHPTVKQARNLTDTPASFFMRLVGVAQGTLEGADRRWTRIDELEAVLAVAQLDPEAFDLLAAHADEVMP